MPAKFSRNYGGARVSARVTEQLKKRLEFAIQQRQPDCIHRVTEGEILSELGARYLRPHPDELKKKKAAVADIGKRKAKAAAA